MCGRPWHHAGKKGGKALKIYLYEGRNDVYLDVCLPCGAGGGRGGDLARTAGRPLPAVLICPGGGYRVVGSTEAGPVSDKFADAGYAAFILHYTVGDGASFGAEGFAGFAPAADLAAALRLLHENAGGYGIDAREIVLVGFSAGGHLCAAYCFADAPIPERLLPKALVLSYPMGGGEDSGGMGKAQPDYDVGRMPYAKDPAVKNLPVFLWHAKDDAVVPFEVSARLDAKLAREGITHTFLAYEHGIHARPFFDPDWFSRALDWLAGLK